jgi:hypothetical protein
MAAQFRRNGAKLVRADEISYDTIKRMLKIRAELSNSLDELIEGY